MTATHASAPATTLHPSRGSPAMLVVGLVACIAGVTMIVASAVLPDPHAHPVVVFTTAATQAAAAPMAVRQDVARATEVLRLSTASGDRTSNTRRAGPITTQEHRNTDQIALVRPAVDIFDGSPRPSPCLKTDFEERATRAESTQLATVPLRQDPRQALITLVAVQHGGPGPWSGQCLMRRLSLLAPIQADSDDRIANALFPPATSATPLRLTGPR